MTPLTPPRGRLRLPLLVAAWAVVNAAGFGLAGAMFHNFPTAYRMPPVLGSFGRFDLRAAVLGGIAFGTLPALLVGGAQRLVLRRSLRLPWPWILTPALGVGSLHFVSDGFPDARDMTLAVIASGAAMGWCQWRLLRTTAGVSPTWIPLTIVAWYGGWTGGMEILAAVGTLHGSWTPSLGATQHSVLGASVGLAYGLVTGVVLSKRAPAPAEGDTQLSQT